MAIVSTTPPLPGLTMVNQINTGFTTTPQVASSAVARDVSLASGTQSITGLGFRPKYVQLLTNINASTVFSFCFASTTSVGFGVYDSGGGNWSALISVASFISIGGGTYTGTVTMDAGGFTITWVKAGLPTGIAIIDWMAMGANS